MIKLNPEAVTTIFMDCLFGEAEDHTHHVAAHGVVMNVGFHPGRLESHRAEIRALLDELPVEFRADGGGGWSFLNMALTKDNQQWTGEHHVMEQLVLLGIGINYVQCLVPREMWAMLPGGMPYYTVGDAPVHEVQN
jgi:hypothetical protein